MDKVINDIRDLFDEIKIMWLCRRMSSFIFNLEMYTSVFR